MEIYNGSEQKLNQSRIMSSLEVRHLVPFVVTMLIIQCDSKAKIGDYIVNCSVCSYLPLTRVDSYHCNVRCDVQNGEYKRYQLFSL